MINRKFITFIMTAVVSLLITSCKQDNVFGDIEPNTERVVVEFADASEARNVSMNYSNDVITLDIAQLRFMSRSYVKEGSTVKIIADPSIVDAYNDDNGTSYEHLSAGYFGFDSPETVLTPEERSKNVRIKIKPSDLGSDEYAIGLAISSVSSGEISTAANKIVIVLSVKNKYDGIYAVKGYAFLGTNTSAPYFFDADCSYEVYAITTGPNTIELDAQPLLTGNPPETTYGFGNVIPAFTFNPVTDAVTAVTPAGGSVSMNYPYGLPYSSRYDPATKSIYVKFGVNNNPAWYIIDTLTYCGPR